MYALNWTREFTADDGLEPLSPLPLPAAAPALPERTAWVPAVAALGGLAIAVLIMLTGPLAQPLVLALGGTAGFVYLGTALISARPGAAALDLVAAAASAGIALAAAGPAASVLLVHVVWGVLRSARPEAAPGRVFATSWAALHATAALFLGFGT
jgi:hypothetical protein